MSNNTMAYDLRGLAIVANLTIFMALTGVSSALAAPALPVPPVTFEAPYSMPGGKVLNVASGGDLQGAINSASPGDVIVLQAGAVFTGPFTLPAKSGSGWIYIQSGNYSQLPAPGQRVGINDAANMAVIQVDAGKGAAIQTAAGAHHFRLIGIEVRPMVGKFVYNLIEIGNNDVSASTLPGNIVIDRCYIHGDSVGGSRRGVAMNGTHVAVVDSYIADFKEIGADTQALWAHNTPGPLKIQNNYLEATGENVLFGGKDSTAEAMVPADIEIRGNYFHKPLSWIGAPYNLKNLLEFKATKRALVINNEFVNNWPAAQNGFAILVTPRNQDGGSPWSVTSDIAFVSNRFRNLGQGFNIAGYDSDYPSQRTERVLIKNNLIEITALQNADGRAFQLLSGAVDISIDHNTVYGATRAFMVVDTAIPIERVAITNSIWIGSDSVYGFIGAGTGAGFATFNTFFRDITFKKNVLLGGGSVAQYPSENYFPGGISQIGFVSPASGEYSLSSSSPYKSAGTDGIDLGANIASLTRAPMPPSNFTVIQ